MNERIKQLAQKAYADVIKNTPSFLVTKELYEQKFAELIVRECGRVYIQNQQDGVMTLTQDLLQHFGVEL